MSEGNNTNIQSKLQFLIAFIFGLFVHQKLKNKTSKITYIVYTALTQFITTAYVIRFLIYVLIISKESFAVVSSYILMLVFLLCTNTLITLCVFRNGAPLQNLEQTLQLVRQNDLISKKYTAQALKTSSVYTIYWIFFILKAFYAVYYISSIKQPLLDGIINMEYIFFRIEACVLMASGLIMEVALLFSALNNLLKKPLILEQIIVYRQLYSVLLKSVKSLQQVLDTWVAMFGVFTISDYITTIVILVYHNTGSMYSTVIWNLVEVLPFCVSLNFA